MRVRYLPENPTAELSGRFAFAGGQIRIAWRCAGSAQDLRCSRLLVYLSLLDCHSVFRWCWPLQTSSNTWIILNPIMPNILLFIMCIYIYICIHTYIYIYYNMYIYIHIFWNTLNLSQPSSLPTLLKPVPRRSEYEMHKRLPSQKRHCIKHQEHKCTELDNLLETPSSSR